MVALGSAFEARPGLLVRPRLELAATRFVGAAAPSVEASFAERSTDAGQFTTRTGLEAPQYKLTAGFDVLSTTGLQIELEAFKSSSADNPDTGAGLNFRVPF